VWRIRDPFSVSAKVSALRITRVMRNGQAAFAVIPDQSDELCDKRSWPLSRPSQSAKI
jgi:hypothetical protein